MHPLAPEVSVGDWHVSRAEDPATPASLSVI
jgi:hypothetical protein